jgi:hypothetical protein
MRTRRAMEPEPAVAVFADLPYLPFLYLGLCILGIARGTRGARRALVFTQCVGNYN